MTEHLPVQGVRGDVMDDLVNRPGAFVFESTDAGLCYMCPCGCGQEGFLPFRGAYRALTSWKWNRSHDAPTLTPSIRRPGCSWHGHLRAGMWIPEPDSGT